MLAHALLFSWSKKTYVGNVIFVEQDIKYFGCRFKLYLYDLKATRIFVLGI